MDDKSLVGGALGSDAKWALALVSNKVQLSFEYDGAFAAASVSGSVGAREFLEMIKALRPGGWEDSVINALEGALGLSAPAAVAPAV